MPARAKPPSNVDNVAYRLRLLQAASGLSQAALARMVGITPQAWNNNLTGDGRIGLDQAMRLCAGLGVTLDWIYRGLANAGLPLPLASKIQEIERTGLPASRGQRRAS
jgi:transcriptional regulator with XRE-family HTH domain